MLSERIPHDEGCNSIYEPWKEPNECDCYVSEVAKYERVARSGLALNVDYSFEKWSEFQQALADLPEGALGG